MGQAEQLSQFLRNFSAPQQNQEPEKKEAKEKQPEHQLQEQLGQLDQLGQLGQLGSLISTFLGPTAVEAAFPLLEALTKAGQDHLAMAGHDGQEQPRKGDNQAMEEQVPAQEKETAEKMDSNRHTGAEDMKDNNEKEDKVEAALKTMKAMGFSDDGGWLSSLLRAKSGDVGKVLDTIQPVKN